MKLFITRPIPADSLEKLTSAGITVDTYEKDETCPREVLLKRVIGVNAIISQTDDDINEVVLTAAGDSLKIVANYGVGFSNIDLESTKKHNVVVTNTPVEAAFDATAEATVCLLTAVAKRIPYLHWYKKVKQTDPEYSPIGNMGVSLRNKVCGIVGMGNIGSRVARIMHKGFNNHIIYYDIPSRPELEQELSASKTSLDTLMKEADFICVNLPYLPTTKNLVNQEMIALIKSNAIFVNTARTGIVDDQALVKRINSGEIHGAGLDIYTDAVDNLKEDANVALTAHMANLEKEAFSAMADCCLDNILAVLTGRQPLTPVN